MRWPDKGLCSDMDVLPGRDNYTEELLRHGWLEAGITEKNC
jgi:hypothetical protein